MAVFKVRNMQTDATTGWAVRAKAAGLRVTSRPGRFGDEINLVKDVRGNFLQVTQNSVAGRNIHSKDLSIEQLRIVRVLTDCGLISP